MKSCITDHYIAKAQNAMYAKVNEFSGAHKNLGRFTAIPVAMLDVGLETIKTPLRIIESIAFAAINLVGKLILSSRCSIKDVLYNIERGLCAIGVIPVTIVMIPLKLFYQVFAIASNPARVESINYTPSMGNPGFQLIF